MAQVLRMGNVSGKSSNLVQLHPKSKKAAPEIIAFHKTELYMILQVYSRRVATGEWRDYAIDMLTDRAVFSIFHRTSDRPLFTVEKNPKLAKKQGAFSVVNATGQILKRGHELKNVLKVLDKKTKFTTV
ncbi:MAG: DUF2794 domain-containing protein [Rhizobiaceae bacterium]|nr:DUF2794 domain-containing protein [Rhizobiaceae bacterium]